MQLNTSLMDLYIPRNIEDIDFKHIKSFHPFDSQILGFLSELSKKILSNKESRLYSDLITFGYWVRKSNLNYLKQKQQTYFEESSVYIGKGIVFHIAPSNVPINFAYSLVTGLLAGNINIVRLSSKSFKQVDILLSIFEELLNTEEWSFLKDYICLVKYNHLNKVLTDYFSSICDLRVIWGGDETIQSIRKSQIPAKSTEICFSDRYSLSVIKCDEFLEVDLKTQKSLIQGFYNDTYLFDQNACTSPHIICWLGEDEEEAKSIFWNLLHELVRAKYDLSPIMSVDKLTTFCKEAILENNIEKNKTDDNYIIRVKPKSLSESLQNNRCPGGYFHEYSISDLSDILPIVNRKVQTLSYYGIEKSQLIDFMRNCRPLGIDRIVPIGKTMDFELIWDGYNLISQMTREIKIN